MDLLDFEFVIMNEDDESKIESVEDGALVWGIFLEGGRWDRNNNVIEEPFAK